MANPAFTDPVQDDTLTYAETELTWSVGSYSTSTFRVIASWTNVFKDSDDNDVSVAQTLDSGKLVAGTESCSLTLPCDGETVTLTLYWEGGSAAITVTASDQPGYQKTSLYYRDDAPRWFQCTRCGFLYPFDETAIDPLAGIRVCLRYCIDKATWGDDIVLGSDGIDYTYTERD